MINGFSLLTAFGVTLFSIMLIKPLALRLKLVDVPGGRKHHHGDIPLVGGIAMFFGLMFALLTLPISLSDYRSFIAGYGLLVVVGVLDDFRELSPKARLFAQIIAALLMTCWGRVVLHNLGDLLGFGDILLNNWAIPFTVFAIVALINAVNMTDGVDGLAGGLALVQMSFLAGLAYHVQATALLNLSLLLISCLIGFLIFNVRILGRAHAVVFMGDAGSMPLGFALLWFLISLTQIPPVAAYPVTMLWIMAIPMLDMSSVMLRRILNSQSPFSPDRRHLHHLLLGLGLTPTQTTLILCTMAVILGAIGVLLDTLKVPEVVSFGSFLMTFAILCVGIALFGKKVRRLDNQK